MHRDCLKCNMKRCFPDYNERGQLFHLNFPFGGFVSFIVE